jgi:hypothetical protein
MNLCEKNSKHMINLLDLNDIWFLRLLLKSYLTTEDWIKISVMDFVSDCFLKIATLYFDLLCDFVYLKYWKK